MKYLSNLKKNFTRLDNRIIQDSNISVECKGVYCYLVSLPNNWQFSLKNIAKALNIGEKKLANIFKELLSHRLIKKWYYNDKNGYRRLEICLYDYGTRDNPTESKREVGLHSLPTQKGELDKKPLNANDCDIQNAETALNASENPSMPKGEVGSTYIYTKEKFTKEILNNNSASANFKNQRERHKQNLLDCANLLYDNESNLTFSKEKWLEWVEYKISRTPKITELAIKMNFKQMKRYGNNAELAVEHSIAGVYQGLFLPKDIINYTSTKKYVYDPRKGNTGQSDFSDNPDDYINENMAGVKKIGDGLFEADLFVLTGRKESKNDDI